MNTDWKFYFVIVNGLSIPVLGWLLCLHTLDFTYVFLNFLFYYFIKFIQEFLFHFIWPLTY